MRTIQRIIQIYIALLWVAFGWYLYFLFKSDGYLLYAVFITVFVTYLSLRYFKINEFNQIKTVVELIITIFAVIGFTLFFVAAGDYAKYGGSALSGACVDVNYPTTDTVCYLRAHSSRTYVPIFLWKELRVREIISLVWFVLGSVLIIGFRIYYYGLSDLFETEENNTNPYIESRNRDFKE